MAGHTLKAFDAKAGSSTVTTDDLAKLRELATAVDNIRTEKAERIAAAQQAAAEIEQLAAQVRGDDPEEATASAEEPEEPAAEPEPAKEPVTASGAVIKPRALDLSRVRINQPRVLPSDPNLRPEISASVDVPGYQPVQPLDMQGVTEGIIRRANALKTAGGGVACAPRTGCRSTSRRSSTTVRRARRAPARSSSPPTRPSCRSTTSLPRADGARHRRG
ncbi:major capsid protein [Streptomyces sp. NPDC059631]|uniref:major capsid protein n=1 Tax=unclassified Streptomyces TaxID=2593676 RepID=UPI0036B5B595